jgi:hypothetical protein
MPILASIIRFCSAVSGAFSGTLPMLGLAAAASPASHTLAGILVAEAMSGGRVSSSSCDSSLAMTTTVQPRISTCSSPPTFMSL